MPAPRALILSALLAGWCPAAALAAAPPAPPAAKSANPEQFWATPHTVTTQGSVTVGGHAIHYTAKAGTLVLRDKAG